MRNDDFDNLAAGIAARLFHAFNRPGAHTTQGTVRDAMAIARCMHDGSADALRKADTIAAGYVAEVTRRGRKVVVNALCARGYEPLIVAA